MFKTFISSLILFFSLVSVSQAQINVGIARHPNRVNATVVLSSTNVTASAYLEVIAAASNTKASTGVWSYVPGAVPIILAVGASGSEVNYSYLNPGTNMLPIVIPKGSRISLKSANGTLNSGVVSISLMGGAP